MKSPFPEEDPYAKEKRFAALFGGILLLVLLISLLLMSAASPCPAVEGDHRPECLNNETNMAK